MQSYPPGRGAIFYNDQKCFTRYKAPNFKAIVILNGCKTSCHKSRTTCGAWCHFLCLIYTKWYKHKHFPKINLLHFHGKMSMFKNANISIRRTISKMGIFKFQQLFYYSSFILPMYNKIELQLPVMSHNSYL